MHSYVNCVTFFSKLSFAVLFYISFMPGLFSCPVQEIYQLFSSHTSLQFIEAVTYVTLSLSLSLSLPVVSVTSDCQWEGCICVNSYTIVYYIILCCTVKKCNDSPTQLNHIRCHRVHLIQNVSLLHWFWLHFCGWCMYNNLLCTNWVQQLCHIVCLAHNSGHN